MPATENQQDKPVDENSKGPANNNKSKKKKNKKQAMMKPKNGEVEAGPSKAKDNNNADTASKANKEGPKAKESNYNSAKAKSSGINKAIEKDSKAKDNSGINKANKEGSTANEQDKAKDSTNSTNSKKAWEIDLVDVYCATCNGDRPIPKLSDWIAHLRSRKHLSKANWRIMKEEGIDDRTVFITGIKNAKKGYTCFFVA